MSNQTNPSTATATAEKRRTKPSTLAVENLVKGGKKNTASSVVGKPAVVVANVNDSAVPAAGNSLLANLLTLRDQGTTYYENFFVPGRNAMQALMGEVYAQFHAAKSAPTYQQNLKVLRQKLKDYGVTVRSTSSDASLFIRMVFKDFDDKQVSIYSRSLTAAYDEGVAPDAFGKFVDDTEGGFYGIVISTATGKPAQKGGGSSAGKDAYYEIQAEQTVETIDNFQWDGNEERCVLIAIRGMDDDSATLKKMEVSEELFFSILAKYAAEKKALLKQAVSGDIDTAKLTLKKVENELSNLETDVGNLQSELRAAKSAGKAKEVKSISVNLNYALIKRDDAVRTRKKLQSEIAAESKEAAVA